MTLMWCDLPEVVPSLSCVHSTCGSKQPLPVTCGAANYTGHWLCGSGPMLWCPASCPCFNYTGVLNALQTFFMIWGSREASSYNTITRLFSESTTRSCNSIQFVGKFYNNNVALFISAHEDRINAAYDGSSSMTFFFQF